MREMAGNGGVGFFWCVGELAWSFQALRPKRLTHTLALPVSEASVCAWRRVVDVSVLKNVACKINLSATAG